MKTNQVMVRPMGGFNVSQRTKDGMFNATELLKQWNEYVENQQYINTPKKGDLKKKDFDHYFRNDSTNEFIRALIKEEGLSKDNPVYLTSRGKNGGTWMHPLLFIDFAMWLNPTFKVKVIKFVYDKMLEYRNDNCEAYKELASALQKIISEKEFKQRIQYIAKALNYIVFGKHEHEARNKNGVEALQKELWELERYLAQLIREGFLKDYDAVITYLRHKWAEKYQPKVFDK